MKTNLLFFILTFSIYHMACTDKISKSTFDIQGHRGCRGLMPENTIPAFIKAVELGVNTIELDVVISKDHKVVVSHEPWISSEICKDTIGNIIPDSIGNSLNIYQINYADIHQYDCGSLPNAKFPEQKKILTAKPTLEAAIGTVEIISKENGYPPVQYNIEIKCDVRGDDIYHPKPEEFVDLVYNVLVSQGVKGRTIIQSFDPRPLNYLNDKDPDVKIAYLTSNQLGYQHNLSRLDFIPDIFSPNHIFVTESMINFFHKKSIKVIPWTVNEVDRMQELIDLSVDGIITDFPDRLIQLISDEH